MKRIVFWQRWLSRRVVQLIGSRFYLNPDPDMRQSILVAGTARSGTTWLGDLIASQLPSRILFEPFNPILVPEYSTFSYFQYMRPGEKNPQFYAYARKVFTGEIRNRWIDRYNEQIFSEYRLIKEIRANLSLKWLHEEFPKVPIIFIVRHPCAVVLSRLKLDWATDDDIEPLLNQPDLVEDQLTPFVDLIKNASTAEEKHAIIWSVSNLVPLKQFGTDDDVLRTIYYENLCTQPEKELDTVFDTIGQPYHRSVINQINRPSQTAQEYSAITVGKDKLSNWKKELSASQIDKILHIVDAFGLSYLYGDSLLPLHKYAL